MKKCRRCSQEKTSEQFYRSSYHVDGLRSYCKECETELRKLSSDYHKKYSRDYYKTNKKDASRKAKKYHQDNKDKRNEYGRKYSTYRVTFHPASNIFVRTRSRAKRLNIPFDLCKRDIIIPNVCPVLGIPLVCGPGKGGKPDSPSIDRIDPDKGYVQGNVRIISNRANTLKNNATIEEIECILEDLKNLKGLE